MTTYQLNDTATIAPEELVVGAVPTDATTITLYVTDGDGTTTSYAVGSLTHPSTGVYTKNVSLAIDGLWSWTLVATGVDNGIQGGSFEVLNGYIYCTEAALKSRLKIEAGDTDDDLEILTAIQAVSAWIDDKTQDFFGQLTATRTFEATDGYCFDPGSLVSITTLKTDEDGDGVFETSWTAGVDYQLLPHNPNRGREIVPYDTIRAIGSKVFPAYCAPGRGQRLDRVQIAGVFGWPAVPAGVMTAALILAEDTFKLKDAPFGVAGFDTFGAVRVRENSPALKFLDRYRRLAVTFA